MGPGDGIQIQRLMDLPTTLETADQPPSSVSNSQVSGSSSVSSATSMPVQRVKSMFQQSSSGKLGPPRLPSHPPPPQRSISHSEAGMRSYFNGSGGVASSTPPPGGPGRPRPALMSGRA